MRGLVKRALEKISKLDNEQIEQLLVVMAEENERLAVTLDSMSDGVLITDPAHRLVLANKAAERMIPLATGKPMGERFLWDVILDRDIATFTEAILSREDTASDQEFALDHGGDTRILSCSILPMVKDGHVRGNILQVVDISEKRTREARLRRAESLASLTTLAAGVAHEIKNPLGSIGIHAQLLEKSVASLDCSDSRAMKEYLEVISEEIERLNRIVVDFLFAVRPMDTQLEPADLNQLLEELLNFLRYELEEGGIKLERDLDPGVPELDLDRRYFKQALLNIVKNAMSAMPQGGTLRVITQVRGDEAMVRISDTGLGMSPEVLEKIFEPYFTTRDFGSGIGLTLVYKVVKEHMGDISVHSREGQGSTFSITLPVPQREQRLITWDGQPVPGVDEPAGGSGP
ncbi:PAS domain-containing sensor histidine kinase [Alkalispirochaeta sphaeroplastigenens]|uniref:histidine kinase n=1 Tax=Alkalispirochaeta sphaeroplastigenens TaxID=1187066 RepID=A0A2S4JG95_9SPIO|nr:ATP-binding protein [Alkalispirochaeta sphaeroplastigenens]POQ98588.1 PAS domain-containing sensor histidine kinase [Alkalispirochaeta sphaeroplastigenens]